jgi:hypothetical protein
MSGATLAAGITDEPQLYVGQPDIIGPVVATDRDRMAAPIVGAVDQGGGPRTPWARVSAKVIF